MQIFSPKPGDLLIIKYDRSNCALREECIDAANKLRSWYPGINVLLIPGVEDLSLLDHKDMEEAGWVRKDPIKCGNPLEGFKGHTVSQLREHLGLPEPVDESTITPEEGQEALILFGGGLTHPTRCTQVLRT